MDKIFAVYYERDVNELGQLFPKEEDRQFGEYLFDLSSKLAEKGVKCILITNQNPYVGNGQFFGYWDPSDDYRYKAIKKLVKPSLIFDKGHIDFNDGCLNFFNPHDFARLGRNKYTQAILVGDATATTQLICSPDDYADALEKIKTDKIVVKPLDENGGIGVTLYDRDSLSGNQSFPVIAQEFIETKNGVEGMVDGRHDIRLYIVGGEIAIYSVRQPAEGGWLSNTHRGGTIQFCNKSQISPELLHFAKPIIEKFDQLGGKFYALDFMRGNDRWYLVEMNDRPGIPAFFQDTNGAVKEFHEKFANMIAKELA